MAWEYQAMVHFTPILVDTSYFSLDIVNGVFNEWIAAHDYDEAMQIVKGKYDNEQN